MYSASSVSAQVHGACRCVGYFCSAMARKKKEKVLRGITMENYAAEGKSLARVDGKAVFVDRTIPGDVVDVFLYKNKKDFAEGWPLEILKPSPDRIEPFCRHFGMCGGCQWQMLPYQKQLAFKEKQVYDQLTRIGQVQSHEWIPIAGATQTTEYRNKIEYTFATRRYLSDEEVKNPDISLEVPSDSFHAKGIFDKVVPIIHCHLQAEPTNLIRETLKAKTIAMDMPFYDIKLHTGWLRNVQIRLCTTGQLMVNVMLGYDNPKVQKELLDHLLETVPAITTLYYTINQKWNDSIYDLQPTLYYGPKHATEMLENYKFLIGPKSFFQTNTRQGERLYQITRDFAELDGSQTVYDLYCGTGSIGIFVSGAAKKVIGVELIPEAIHDAEENAAINGLAHCSFFAGDVIKICDDVFFATHGKPDVIITDPPRAGMHADLVQKILDMEAPTVVYVSCNPATQARDLKLLQSKYDVMKSQAVDMFPHTHHIENVVQLKLKNS